MGTFRAVKIVRRCSFSNIRPFERELSGIEKFEPISRSHEGLVDVLHVGRDDERGYFYYIMELGDDVKLGQNIDPANYSPKTLAKCISLDGRLAVEECLRLGLALTEALGRLHKHGLVHRDVKPSNIIFVHGVPKLADIGLVAATTEARSYVGTEGFIPPEGPGSVQADLYGLGKVLYEASTGLDRNDFPKLPDGFQAFIDQDRFLELNEVLLDACRSDPRERYKNAWDFHNHLLLISHGKSVKRLRVLERRLAAVKRAGGVIGMIVLIATVVGYGAYRDFRLRADERIQEIGKDIAYGNRDLESGDLLGSLPYFVSAFDLERAKRDAEATDRLRIGSILCQCPKLTGVWQDVREADFGEFSPDGMRAVVACYGGRARMYDLSGARSNSVVFGQANWVTSASFSADNRWIVTASEDGSANIWDAATLKLLRVLKDSGQLESARFSPDGRELITASVDGYAYVWDVLRGRKIMSFGHAKSLRYAEFSHNGRFIVTAAEDDTAKLWAANGKLLTTFSHPSWVYYASFSPDDAKIVTACADHVARVWDLSGNRLYPDMNHDDVIRSAEFSPDGRFIVTASIDRTARLWNARSLTPVNVNPVIRSGERLNHASFSPDGNRILLTGLEGTVEIWDFAGCSSGRLGDPCIFSADESRIAKRVANRIEVVDSETGCLVGKSLPCADNSEEFELNRTGRFGIAYRRDTVGAEAYAEIWSIEAGNVIGPPITLADSQGKVVVSDDGKRAAWWSNSVVQMFDPKTLAPILQPLRNSGRIALACFDPAGALLLVQSERSVSLWSVATGERLGDPFVLPLSISHVEFSHNGKWIVACDRDDQFTRGNAYLYDVKIGKRMGLPMQHEDGVTFARFSPDDNLLATASEDFTAAIWNWRTGVQVIPAVQHRGIVCSVDFNSNGTWFTTASSDKTARVWSVKTGDPLTPSLYAPFVLRKIFISGSGSNLIGIDKTGRSIIWKLPSVQMSIADLTRISKILVGGKFDGNNSLEQPVSRSLRREWQEMAAKYPSAFDVSSNDVSRWHESARLESVLEGDVSAAAFHQGYLIPPEKK
jgi:WD40 repeat protein